MHSDKWIQARLDQAFYAGPPCPSCQHWEPAPSCSGWRFCHAKKMQPDFSCYRPKKYCDQDDSEE